MPRPTPPVQTFHVPDRARSLACLLVVAGVLGLPLAGFGDAGPVRVPSERAAAGPRAPGGPQEGPFGPELVRQLVRLNDRLELETFPDASPLWPARLAAAIEHRTGGRYGTAAGGETVRGRELLRRLAADLRGLMVGQAPVGADPQDAEAGPPGRDRAMLLRRILETVRLLHQKLDRMDRGLPGRKGTIRSRAAPANDACDAATVIGEGRVSGSTSEATADGSSSCSISDSSPDVWFRYTASADGFVTFSTNGSSYDTVLSLHTGCPSDAGAIELACSDDVDGTVQSEITDYLLAGEEVWVRMSGFGGLAGDFDLSVYQMGAITGTVTRQDTGLPLSGALVKTFDFAGGLAGEVETDAEGRYLQTGLGGYRHYVRARAAGFISEVYDDVQCPFYGYCYPPNDGTPIEVATVGITSGIDLALSAAGGLGGSVTAADTGAPLRGYVYLYTGTGDYLDSVRVNTDGSYEIAGLPTGKYRVVASYWTYQDEVYDNVPCGNTCDPMLGAEVPVVNGAIVAGVDFALDRLGAISGTLTDSITGDPVVGRQVSVYEDANGWISTSVSASDGTYESDGLGSGAYFVVTEPYPGYPFDNDGYLDEVYDDVPCDGPCEITNGDPVNVTAGATSSGIDFALIPLGRIAGSLVDAETGEPIASQQVAAYDSAGALSGYASTGTDGSYEMDSLEPGAYTVRTVTSTYQNELWNGIVCDRDCDVTTGDPVTVALSATTSGIDFSLIRRGRITGTVTNTLAGPFSASPFVQFYYDDGTSVSTTEVMPDGSYASPPLPEGDYFVLAGETTGWYIEELYDDIQCVGCDPKTGRAVTVTPTTMTSGIDFTLDRLGEIRGIVTAADTGMALPALVRVVDGSGAFIRGSYAGSDGAFKVGPLTPGAYYARTSLEGFPEGDSYQEELFDDMPCEPSCDVTDGVALSVALNRTIVGVDFALGHCPVDSYRDIKGFVYLANRTEEACESVTAGTGTRVERGVDITFKAGRKIVLTDGFAIESGASFRAVIEPAWVDD